MLYLSTFYGNINNFIWFILFPKSFPFHFQSPKNRPNFTLFSKITKDIKIYNGREKRTFKNVLYFNIVNNVSNRIQ